MWIGIFKLDKVRGMSRSASRPEVLPILHASSDFPSLPGRQSDVRMLCLQLDHCSSSYLAEGLELSPISSLWQTITFVKFKAN